ncbi:unnamed protein product, partial [Ostreobium quekettii]
MIEEEEVRLRSVLESGRLDQVAGVLDDIEIQSQDPQPLLNWPHALHLLAHAYNLNLEEGRFLWKRIPESVKQGNTELQSAFRVLGVLWNRQYECYWPALSGHQWSPDVKALVDELTIRLRNRVVDLVCHAYSTIFVAKFAGFVGLTEKQAIARAQEAGWELLRDKKTLKVKRPAPSAMARDGFKNLQQLT